MSADKYDLIIFDCDGTLTDSEYLNNKVTADVLTGYGLEGYTAENCMRDFGGKDWKSIKSLIDEKHKINLPRYVIDNYIQNVQSKMKSYLKPICGALEFVEIASQDFKICVGSNGERGNVTKSLLLMGFGEYFSEENIFTKIQVAKAKPAPDLFLYAADKMNVDPSRCLVLEDSISGAGAGIAAGMDVIGFTGVSHNKKQSESDLKKIGCVAIYDDFIHIGKHLGY